MVSLTKKYPFFLIISSLLLLYSGCTPKIKFPIVLTYQAKEGGKELSEIYFKSTNYIYVNDEMDRATETSVLFDLSTEVLKTKPDGKIVLFQTTKKKDGLLELNRLGLPELGEEIQVEIDKRGFILDVSG